MRGKIYGLLQLSMPMGYLVGMVLGLQLSGAIGWRGVFYITGSLGVLLSIFLFLGLKEPPRGQSEPEMDGLEKAGTYRFDWKIAKGLFHIRSLRLMFLQGFFGTFPWNAITYWFFAYLQEERGYDDTKVMVTMIIAVLVLAAGYPLGGALGDRFFRRTPRGRLLVSIFGVVAGLVLMTITLNIPNSQEILFLVLLSTTALFVPFSSPNVVATVYDVTLPEVRSTAAAVQSFIEEGGTALSPLLVGIIADALSLKAAFLIICCAAWALCAIVYTFAAILIPKDIETLRGQMRQRAEQEKAHQPAIPHPSGVTYD
jgi:MFS family permease